MELDLIADLHGNFPKLRGGDLLIIAGDLTRRAEYQEYILFAQWLNDQDYEEKIIIGGNHDNRLQATDIASDVLYDFTYLQDNGCVYEGLNIWGSPWTKTFKGMNPKCKAFTVNTEDELKEKWSLIPSDTNILITHSPMYGKFDEVFDGHIDDWKNVGSTTLVDTMVWMKGLKLHVCGHIHEGYGFEHFKEDDITFVNASHVDENYIPCNPPVRIIL
jgi:Icc-related predicted phosphoesterase